MSGRGISESLTKVGTTVIICAIDEEAGEKLAETLNGEFYQLDVTDIVTGEEVAQDILDKHKEIDIPVANPPPIGPKLLCTIEDFFKLPLSLKIFGISERVLVTGTLITPI